MESTKNNEMPQLAIIVVTYRTPAMTAACIESIKTHLSGRISFELLLINNHSEDETSSWALQFAESHPWFSYFPQKSNLGFSRANNVGIARSSAPIILLLNSDTYLQGHSLIRAVEFLHNSDKTVFGCGCTLLNPDGTTGISYGNFPSLSTVIKETLQNRFGGLRAVVPEPAGGPYKIDFPCGAFFAFKREMLETIGGPLDENFFMYFEETDLAARATRAGLSIWLVPSASVVHIGGASSSASENISRLRIFYRSWRRYATLHASIAARWGLFLLLLLQFTLRSGAALIRSKRHSVWPLHLRALYETWLIAEPTQ